MKLSFLAYRDQTGSPLQSIMYRSPKGPSIAVYHSDHFHSIFILFFHSVDFLSYFFHSEISIILPCALLLYDCIIHECSEYMHNYDKYNESFALLTFLLFVACRRNAQSYIFHPPPLPPPYHLFSCASIV